MTAQPSPPFFQRVHRHLRAIAALAAVLIVLPVSGFAQTNTLRSRDITHSSVSATRVYSPMRAGLDAGDAEKMPLAPNVSVTSLYRPMVERMLERSPTFRRQNARIANAAGLTIDVRGQPGRTHQTAAMTTIERRADAQGIHAIVTITSIGRPAELIAHELEHIIEQLDGVNLMQKASMPSTGVRHCHCGTLEAFETNRAVATGLQVAREVGERRD